MHLEHSAIELRGNRGRVDADRKVEGAGEPPERALHAVVALALVAVLEPALPRDGQHVVLDLDLDVVLAEPWKIGSEDELVLGLDQVDGRNPPLALQLTRRIPSHECISIPPIRISLLLWSRFLPYREL